jgi:hypothetical protein
MRIGFILALSFLFASQTYAQVFEMRAGDSTLFDAQGASVRMYGNDVTAEVGAGMVGGHFVIGANEKQSFHGMQLTAGDLSVPFSMPTDWFPSFSFYGRGVSLSKELGNWPSACGTVKPAGHQGLAGWIGECHKSKLLVFVGETTDTRILPFFGGTLRGEKPTALLFYTREIASHLEFDSYEIAGSRLTAIQSLSYGLRDLSFAASAGLGSNQLYGAVSARGRRSWGLFRAQYTSTTPNFRRVVVSPYVTSEGAGLNALGALTLRHFVAQVEHDNIYSPILTGSSTRATVTTESVSGSLGAFQLHAANYDSTSLGKNSSGQSFGGGFRIGRFDLRSDEFISSATHKSTTSSLTERLTRKFSLSEFVTTNNGRTNVSWGGGYHSNQISADVSYQTVYAPLRGGSFQQVIAVNIEVHLPHDVTLNGGTVADPGTGNPRFTIYETSYFYSNRFQSSNGHHAHYAKYILKGRVFDPEGRTVEGAAIQIGKDLVFSNSDGEFFIRESKSKEYPVVIALTEFSNPGRWKVIEAPTSAKASHEEQSEPVKIVVEKGA